MKTAQRIVALAVLLGSCLISVGCNTTQGAGKDMERAGEKIQDAAERNK